ncbi:MAG: arginine--tRNA ligase [Acidobacteriota bacterium]
MSSSLSDTVKKRLLELVKEHFAISLSDTAGEVPPKTELGDLAFPIAFELAKQLKAATGQKRNPREIATLLSEKLRELPGVARVEVAGAGYLNVFFDRSDIFRRLISASDAVVAATDRGKMIVEHTSINPNKAAHIGHVRNAVLGDTIVRILRATGEEIEVHNYIDNTGVQVADVVVGFLYLEKKSIDEVKAIIDPSEKFDYLCWDLYARVGAWYEEDKTRLELRAKTLHQIESGEGDVAAAAELISTRIVRCHLATMARLDISYHLLARESDILHLHFWKRAFELLKSSGAIVLETEGRNKGCWVMRAETQDETSQDADREHDADKIIVRSNGTVTYTGKDIAYHLWKLGKLGLEFKYRPFSVDHRGQQVWMTTADESQATEPHPVFGNGTAFLNVIDVGQSYPQANVKRGVMEIDHDARVARSAHLAYEKVTLTPAAAVELGTELSDADAQKAQIGMSGRKGLGVKADDLIDRLEAGAFEEVRSRHAELDEQAQRGIAHQIAVAALRYFLLKYTRTSIIAFDFKEALSFEGETGPYIQYSVVRANNIFRKLGRTPDEVRADVEGVSSEAMTQFFAGEGGDELWSLVTLAGRLDEVVASAASNFEPTQVAKYAFQLAKAFNLFYHNFHILSETDAARKTLLLMVADLVRRRLETGLGLLGIEAPERM